MSDRTEVSFDAALTMALRADAQKELDELPTPAQLKELYPVISPEFPCEQYILI